MLGTGLQVDRVEFAPLFISYNSRISYAMRLVLNSLNLDRGDSTNEAYRRRDIALARTSTRQLYLDIFLSQRQSLTISL